MAGEKLSRKLTEALADSQDHGTVDVVLELNEPPPGGAPGAGRAQQIAARKEAFTKQAEPLADHIRRLGGEVTGQAWINSTMRARLSRQMVSALSDAPQVKRLDIPHQLQADSTESE